MVMLTQQRATIPEFEQFIALPQNSEKRFELVMGEIVEVPSNMLASKIALLIGAAIVVYLAKHDIGHATTTDGGYVIGGQIYAPDVAFVSYERQRTIVSKGFTPVPPNLAVEVISDPSNPAEQATLRRKLGNYLASDVVVWIVDPFDRHVEIYQGAEVIYLDETGVIDGGDILPGFELPLHKVFSQIPSDDS